MMNRALNMTGGSSARGYLITLPAACSYLEVQNLTAAGGAWVQPVYAGPQDTAPIAPTATPAPANDAEADFIPLLSNGARTVFDGKAGQTGLTGGQSGRQFTHLRVWSTGNGYLTYVGV